MATNKRDLKAYSRFDGTGRIVPGSTVLRRNKPKNGNWKEVQGYECCNPGGSTTRLISSIFNQSSNFFSIYYISANNVFISDAYTGTTIEEWLEYFNARFGWMGVFSPNPEDSSQIFFDIKTEIFNSLGNPADFQLFYVGPA